MPNIHASNDLGIHTHIQDVQCFQVIRLGHETSFIISIFTNLSLVYSLWCIPLYWIYLE